MTMLENEVGARYQPHHDATFVDFGSDRRSDSYVIQGSETSKYPNPDIRLPSACIWIRIRIFLPIFGFGFGLEARIR